MTSLFIIRAFGRFFRVPNVPFRYSKQYFFFFLAFRQSPLLFLLSLLPTHPRINIHVYTAYTHTKYTHTYVRNKTFVSMTAKYKSIAVGHGSLSPVVIHDYSRCTAAASSMRAQGRRGRKGLHVAHWVGSGGGVGGADPAKDDL